MPSSPRGLRHRYTTALTMSQSQKADNYQNPDYEDDQENQQTLVSIHSISELIDDDSSPINKKMKRDLSHRDHRKFRLFLKLFVFLVILIITIGRICTMRMCWFIY